VIRVQPQEIVWLDVSWALQIATGGRAKVVRGKGPFVRIGSSGNCEVPLPAGFPPLAGYLQFDNVSGWFIDFQLKDSPPKPVRISAEKGAIPSITSSSGSYSIQILSIEPIDSASLPKESHDRPLANTLCLTNGRLKEGDGNRIFKIPLGFSVLGGSQNCHLRLRHRTVKEAHCLLFRSAKAGGSIRVIDLCAVPPVTICGVVPRGNLVRDGDILQVGKMELAAKLLEVAVPGGAMAAIPSNEFDSASTIRPSSDAMAIEGVFANEADFLTASDRKIDSYTMSKKSVVGLPAASDSRLEKLDSEFRRCAEALEGVRSVVSRLEQNQSAIQEQILAIVDLVKRTAAQEAPVPMPRGEIALLGPGHSSDDTREHTPKIVGSFAACIDGGEDASRDALSSIDGADEANPVRSGSPQIGCISDSSVACTNSIELERISNKSSNLMDRFEEFGGNGLEGDDRTAVHCSSEGERLVETKYVEAKYEDPKGQTQPRLAENAIQPETVPEAMVLSTLMDLRTRDDVTARNQLAMLLSCVCVGIAVVMLFVWFTIPTGWRARFIQDLLSGFASG
jgi:hypothetical protein